MTRPALAGQSGWGSAANVAGLILGSGLFAGFLVREARTSAPMIPLGLFRIREPSPQPEAPSSS